MRYDQDAIDQLSFIRHARELGFPMDAIRELLSLQTDPGNDCAAADALARTQLEAVQKRLRQLQALENELQNMIASCEGGEQASCKIISALNDHAESLNEAHEKLAPL